jgi:uncharacterized protein (DUF1697 family)
MMKTYVAFLRAINVAGHAILKKDALRASFVAAGCVNARTFIQSGNVIFECSEKQRLALFRKIRAQLRPLIGGEPTILYRSLDDLERLVKANPFRRLGTRPATKLYVTFLSDAPAATPRLPLTSDKEALEAFAMKDLDVFIVSGRKKNGFYGFPNNFIEKELGVSGTTRNWSTVTRIVALGRSGVA